MTDLHKTDAEIDAMSDGDFYHHMLNEDQYMWAYQCNRKLKLDLTADQVEGLATWFANAQMAALERPSADYIRARLDAENEEDAAAGSNVPPNTEQASARS